ncbi:unnamed protein product [Didymodactylos carnosus]|uniref:Tubulin--tyrosine ligase-like protein 12 SET-like domain-containing protein n=1 Tax=Didymodactylos carnosus TaxID=1234261 RepID=A0A8S2CKZ9_9BILA|nr:unnamed protein product [Didymodactylos carnosus]CAF3508548.1 unnamed protein product [Didymodactylos carnosus]
MNGNDGRGGDPQIDSTILNSFIDLHRTQLELSNIPEHYWPNIYRKLHNEIFDVGEYFQIVELQDDEDKTTGRELRVKDEHTILNKDDPYMIFIIDHAYTYRLDQIQKELHQLPQLVDRLCHMMFIDIDEEHEKKIEKIIEEMWKLNHTYTLTTAGTMAEDREPYWYILDEVGSSISHDDYPCARMAPFYSMLDGTMYTLLWLVENVSSEDRISVDYAYGITDNEIRRAKLVPWTKGSLTDIDIQQTEPSEQYFNTARENELLPMSNMCEIDLSSLNRPVNVFTDLELVRNHLFDQRFCITDTKENADILFIRTHFKTYNELFFTSQFVNQYPFENVITIKDLLAIVCRRLSPGIDRTTLKSYPEWLPTTYNLTYELSKFISYYQQREQKNLDNHWIIKPWNLARSIDTHVTKNLNQIVRLAESGPKVVCKYIEKPLLFYRDGVGNVKFDIRYIVLLHTIQPLKLFVYEKFWLRFANKPYSLDNFDDYEKHFTVMNYRHATTLKKITCDEFIPLFEQQNPNQLWRNIETDIFKMIHQIFLCAASQPPPRGFGHCNRSRAIYAVDLMLDNIENDGQNRYIQPKLCEVNFMPDIERACIYYPTFINDIFQLLFLNDYTNQHVIDISHF